MKKRSRGNFVVLSGLVVAALIAAVSIGVWKMQEPPRLSKPVVSGASLKPLIVGPKRTSKKVQDSTVARVTGVNNAVKEEVSPTDQPPAPPLSKASEEIPEIVRKSEEKGLWIYIDKAAFTLYLAEGNKVLNSWGVAVGKVSGNKQKVGDMRTPEGTFSVQAIQDARSRSHDFTDGKGVIKHAYGPWFIRLKTGKWKGIGIHGTHAPESIGTLATEGCIRLKNEDVAILKTKVKPGMKVVIGVN